jgi:hypothetical protein
LMSIKSDPVIHPLSPERRPSKRLSPDFFHFSHASTSVDLAK